MVRTNVWPSRARRHAWLSRNAWRAQGHPRARKHACLLVARIEAIQLLEPGDRCAQVVYRPRDLVARFAEAPHDRVKTGGRLRTESRDHLFGSILRGHVFIQDVRKERESPGRKEHAREQESRL